MASSPRLSKPALWIIAGPNGSGKSSAYGMASVEEPAGSVWIINPDLLTRRIADTEGLADTDANLESVRRIETWLHASIDTHQTIGVETVLSTDKYRRLVDHARSRGFAINLIYVYLDTVERNIGRVRTRAAKGGHDVPQDKIRSRRERSFDQFGWFLLAADRADVFDNSGATPRRVMSKRGDEVSIFADLPEPMIRSLSREIPGLFEDL